MTLLTAAEMAARADGVFKFVRVALVYRFHDMTDDYTFLHRDMLAAGEVAESAGSIFLSPAGWKFYAAYSDSLGITADERTHTDLPAILGRPELMEKGI